MFLLVPLWLTDMLTEHAKESFPEIFSLYYPVAWR
ncbi:T3SS effector EspX [Escherichia coli]|uniref:T3SS effector EspX n=1 Tax=Escherichia coli TaxID=562 RepID=A0AB38EZQ8_ECOLX|nr:T3SS effector EspX [Escherichia coli]